MMMLLVIVPKGEVPVVRRFGTYILEFYGHLFLTQKTKACTKEVVVRLGVGDEYSLGWNKTTSVLSHASHFCCRGLVRRHVHGQVRVDGDTIAACSPAVACFEEQFFS